MEKTGDVQVHGSCTIDTLERKLEAKKGIYILEDENKNTPAKYGINCQPSLIVVYSSVELQPIALLGIQKWQRSACFVSSAAKGLRCLMTWPCHRAAWLWQRGVKMYDICNCNDQSNKGRKSTSNVYKTSIMFHFKKYVGSEYNWLYNLPTFPKSLKIRKNMDSQR